MWAEAMSLWLEDLTLMDAETLEDLCDDYQEKVNEGREELRRREEEDEEDDYVIGPEEIARENRNDDMAAWLGVKRA